MMEVETRAPIGPPPRPFSEAPAYSPITPERGPTPEQEQSQQHNDRRIEQAAASSDQFGIQGLVPELSLAEKLRLGEGDLQGMEIDTQGVQLNGLPPATLLAGDMQLLQAGLQSINPFPNGNPAFQPIPGQEIEDADSMLIPPLVDDSAFMESATSVQGSELNRIRAFAKLEFEDGQFYMNTYAIEIGRDRDAARQAERKKLAEQDRKDSEGKSRDGSNPDLERAQKHPEPGVSAAASVVSGGIMHMGDADDRGRRKKKRSKSTGSSGKGPLLRETTLQNGKTDYQALANASLLDQHSARPVDLTNMMPSPDECPLIPIHPPPDQESGLTGYKGISRKHVRIAYNHEKGLFELHVLGKNGCFIEGAHMEQGEVIALASGSEIQIGGVSMKFILPNVPDGETGTDLRSDAVSHSAMSFDFEDGRGESAAGEQDSESPTTDNEDDRYRELRLAQKAEALLSDEDDDEDEDLEDEEDEPEVDVRKSRPKIMLKISSKSKSKPKPAVEEEPPPKRKVGRPPKNGIMSKREEAELRRKEKEAAKAAKAKEKKAKKTVEEPDGAEAEPVVKMEEEDVEEPSPAERRKAKKTKPEEPAEQTATVIESIEKENEHEPSQTPVEQPTPTPAPAPAPRPPKKERPAKPPRSPSPVFKEEDLTPEQLAKPTSSYVVLIHEALSNHPDGRMSLPQIYRAIERRYPYYKLRVQTVGWQSSVRHNLSQHSAFVKIERDGKGWMWGLDPSVPIEREKKRRPSPPPMQTPGWNNPGANGFNRNFPPNVYATTNGQMPQNPYAMFPNAPPPVGRGFPPASPVSRPPSFPQQQQQPQPPAASATYQSPYGGNRQPGQAPVENGQASSGQAVPQMPAPYLSQNRANQPGQNPPQAASSMSANQRQPLPPSQQRPVGVPSPAFSSAFSPPLTGAHDAPAPILEIVERFRSVLISKPIVSGMPDGEAMVNQVVNKCMGRPPPADQPFKVFGLETAIMKALKSMLSNSCNWPVEGMIAFAEGKRPDRPPIPVPAPPAAAAATAATVASPQSSQPPPPPLSVSRPPSAPSASSPPARMPPTHSAIGRPPPPLPPQYQAPPQRPVQTQAPPQTHLQTQTPTPAPGPHSATPAAPQPSQLPPPSVTPQQEAGVKRPLPIDSTPTQTTAPQSSPTEPPAKRVAQ